MAEFNFPSEVVELPSKGLIYPEDHLLRKGTVEIKYMTAKEEDILTNQNYIEKGIVLDKLLESLVIDKFDLNDLHVGDKNAIMIASRILGYGKDYEFEYEGKKYTVDLSTLENKPFDETILTPKGTVEYVFPASETKVEFKFLSDKEEERIQQEVKSMAKLNKGVAPEITTRMKYLISSVGGDNDKNNIKSFVDNYLLARDARALRNYIKEISPDINLVFTTDSGEEATLPIGLNFFWPDL